MAGGKLTVAGERAAGHLFRLGVFVGCLLAAAVGPPAARATLGPNPIQIENARPGTSAWDHERGWHGAFPIPLGGIEGYSSEISLLPGDALHLHVSTSPAAPYRIEVYRLGWYQGKGGRLMACRPSCTGVERGTRQPVPPPDPQTGELDAGWPLTDTIQVGASWTSGYFVAKLVLTGGPHVGHAFWVPFIVRARPGQPRPMLVQASVNTWEAYNNWGGKSLYAFNSAGPVVPATDSTASAIVSFDRPFSSASYNSGPFSWEYQLVRFLERRGYDVSYQTDVDTDSDPASLLGHRLDIVSGHDEYWSSAMRAAWQQARDAGTNLAFLGGNIGYWQTRYGSGDRTLIEYRQANLDPDPDPTQKTVRFAQLTPPEPECQLLGIGSEGSGAAGSDPPRSYSVAPGAGGNPWFTGTGLAPGTQLFDSVGYEWDSIQPGCLSPPPTVLLHFAGLQGVAGSSAPADAVTYTASSGATVFSDGSMQLVWALDDFAHVPHTDTRVQRLFANLFDDLAAPPPSIPPSTLTLLWPWPAVSVFNRRPRLLWQAAVDPLAAVTRYLVVLDGRLLGTTNGTSYSMRRALRPGHHSWRIVAIDVDGRRIRSAARGFTIAARPKR